VHTVIIAKIVVQNGASSSQCQNLGHGLQNMLNSPSFQDSFCSPSEPWARLGPVKVATSLGPSEGLTPITGALPVEKDKFDGDNAGLAESINALIAIADRSGSNTIRGNTRTLLEAAASRLMVSAQPRQIDSPPIADADILRASQISQYGISLTAMVKDEIRLGQFRSILIGLYRDVTNVLSGDGRV
jgi:hypothetical protein